LSRRIHEFVQRSVALLLAAVIFWSAPADPAPATRMGLPARLSAPVASLLASVEWVRFELALLEGEDEVAYAHAEDALRLDASAEEGWILLAQHLAFDRASAAREADRERRRGWIEEALSVLDRGRERVRHPAELDFMRALVLTHVARLVEEGSEGPTWPGGARAALEAAAEAFERAFHAGRLDAADQAAGVRSLMDAPEH
jgi:hypothetical protein